MNIYFILDYGNCNNLLAIKSTVISNVYITYMGHTTTFTAYSGKYNKSYVANGITFLIIKANTNSPRGTQPTFMRVRQGWNNRPFDQMIMIIIYLHIYLHIYKYICVYIYVTQHRERMLRRGTFLCSMLNI